MQAQGVHETIHHEGRTGHIPGIFKHGYEEVKEKQHGHEGEHAANSADYPVDQQGLDPGATQSQSG